MGYFYIQNDNRGFLCYDEENKICWSQYIIDAKLFSSEEEAEQVRIDQNMFWCGVVEWSRPPAAFLYKTNELIPKEKRIYYYDHTRWVPSLYDVLMKIAEDYEKEQQTCNG